MAAAAQEPVTEWPAVQQLGDLPEDANEAAATLLVWQKSGAIHDILELVEAIYPDGHACLPDTGHEDVPVAKCYCKAVGTRCASAGHTLQVYRTPRIRREHHIHGHVPFREMSIARGLGACNCSLRTLRSLELCNRS